MRQVVLDTETTGLEWKNGDRVVEIGCVELLNRKLTGNDFHRYLNPERVMSAEAERVHGLSEAFLADKPKFAEVADSFAEYVRGAQVIIHNAAFDVGFLNSELARCGLPSMEELADDIIDTLKMARAMHPGKRASLDALCERYGVDNAHRTLHGALLDAQILADVYVAMTRGQDSLDMGFDSVEPQHESASASQMQIAVTAAPATLRVIRAADEELEAHRAILAQIGCEGRW